MMKHLIKLLRPQQWVKNAFVLLPLFFGGQLFDVRLLVSALLTALAYSFAASSIYCFNDIYDVDDDRRHPAKCHRPVASGAISVPQAYGLMGLMAMLSALTIALLPVGSGGVAVVIGFYWLLNLAYCARLKRLAIIDVCVVAFGFVLRLAAGSEATGVALSHWIVLMTFLLTLFLSLAKRRDDVKRMMQTGQAPRENTSRYNMAFINQAITITSSVTLVCYIMYTVSPGVVSRFGSEQLYLTTIFVLLGLLRYIQLAVVDEQTGDPTKVMLRDRFIQVIVICWGLSFAALIYL